MVTVQPIHEPHKQKTPDRKPLLAATLAIALLAGGSIGWLIAKQQQQLKIEQAQVLLTDACRADFGSNASAWNTAQTQVDRATQLLNSVPPVPGLGHATAQQHLRNFSACTQNVNAAQDVFTAQQISQAALQTRSDAVLSVQEWQTLATNLEQAIALTRAIPNTASLYAVAQRDLVTYQTQLSQIQQRQQYEQEAVNALTQAQTLRQEADQLLQNPTNPDAYRQAEAKMQQAMQWLQTIPPGHTVSQQSREALPLYQQRLAEIRTQYARSLLQPLVQQFKTFANWVSSLDLRSESEFHAYSDRTHELQDQFDTLMQTSDDLALNPASQNLAAALTRYNDVADVWHTCHTGGCQSSILDKLKGEEASWWLPVTFTLEGDSQSLATKYELPVTTNFIGQHYLHVNTTLPRIWQQAEQKIVAAEDILGLIPLIQTHATEIPSGYVEE